ncbi:MAG: hydrogenase [Casimicrobiaceae bacterium]
MAIPMPLAAGADPMAYPLIAQLFAKHGYVSLDAGNFDEFAGRPGRTLLMFLEDPVRFKETLDLVVIVPEIARAFAPRLAVGVLLPEAARAFASRYAFRRWPAFVILADGHYVGAVDGLRNWDEYLVEVAALLERAPARPPTIGIPVRGDGEGAGSCHA